MTEAQLREVTDLKSTVRKLTERLAKPDAQNVIGQYFEAVYVSESVKRWVTKHLLERPIPLTGAGDVDAEKLTKLAEAATIEACEEGWRAEYDSTLESLAGFVMGEAQDGADKAERKKFKRLHEAFKQGRAA